MNFGLTVKQEKFCNKYLECGNASEAYRFAYDCKNLTEKTIWSAASVLLDKPKVAQRVAYLKANLAEAAGITALAIVKEHQRIAFSNGARIRKGWMALNDFEALTDDDKACIQSVETKQTKRIGDDGSTIIDEWVRVKTYDKQKSLDALSKMLGFDAPTKIEVTASPIGNAHKVIFENFKDE